MIDSHRGAFKEGLLENSIPAFEQSYKEGANVVECDLRPTDDDEIVLIHNSSIDHILSYAKKLPARKEFDERPSGKVKNHTLEYLHAVEFENNAKILSLPELLRWMKKRKVGAQLELKANCGKRLFEDIEAANIPYDDLLGPVVVTSFNWLLVRKMKKRAKKFDIPLYDHSGNKGLAFGFQAMSLGSFIGKWIIRRLEKHNIWGGMTHYRYMPVKRLEYAHKHGIKFCPRVPDDKDLIYEYLDAGVDGFETDNVPLVRRCCKEKGIKLWDRP